MYPLSPSEFFQAIWPEKLLTHEHFELRSINREDRTITREFYTSCKELLEEAEVMSNTEDCYFGVCTRFGKQGKKHDCYRTCAVWLDFDCEDLPEFESDLEPNIVVKSGGGWHCYWLLRGNIFVREERRWGRIEAINRALAQKFGGDDASIDIARILRVPDTLNHKYFPARRVEAYELAPEFYTLELFEALGLSQPRSSSEPLPVRATGRNRMLRLPLRLRRRLQTPGGGKSGDASREDLSVMCAMLFDRLSPEEVLTTFLASRRGEDVRNRGNHDVDDYLRRTIGKAISYMRKRGHR